jgi:hypothetical protein
MGPEDEGLSAVSHEDGNRYGIRNVVFFRISDEGHSPKTEQSRAFRLCEQLPTWLL